MRSCQIDKEHRRLKWVTSFWMMNNSAIWGEYGGTEANILSIHQHREGIESDVVPSRRVLSVWIIWVLFIRKSIKVRKAAYKHLYVKKRKTESLCKGKSMPEHGTDDGCWSHPLSEIPHHAVPKQSVKCLHSKVQRYLPREWVLWLMTVVEGCCSKTGKANPGDKKIKPNRHKVL